MTFKILASAIEHKTATLHDDIKEEYFLSRFEPFPPIQLSKPADSLPEILPFEDIAIGEPVEPVEKREFYVCLSCRLTFKDRRAAAEHKANSGHKVVRENYPIGPSYPANFEKLSDVRGSNIDYDAFFQRTIDDVPNEN
ncbi:hypothetical protein [Candidatus Nitrososphaera gargensis]|uniref:hypothetical protein n=1 Tax=Candidatus Nitrososphaera gargensis TaxID=497727 RepID=UPI0011E50F6B|nr:hypothetical protein [Candidatus Nitrososphaera gargensis]